MLQKPESQDTLFEHYFYKVIPEDHLLRRVQKTVDFSFIHKLVEEKYCSNNGRNAKSPELMFKICLLEYLYNLSDVKVVEEIQVNMAFRWFLGLKLDDEVPDDSTISYFRSKRLGEKAKKNPRNVYITDYYHDLKKGREHYRTDEYKEASKQRHKVERRHADQVKNHGLRHSRFIGLKRTRIHGLMSAIASNIKRMAKLFLGKFPRGISAPSPA